MGSAKAHHLPPPESPSQPPPAVLPQDTPPAPGPRWRAIQMATLAGAVALTLPGLFLRLSGAHPAPGLAAFLFGLSVVGAAFLLSWGAEVAQRDIPQALALTILALIAVLPEYAVDAYLAWRAAAEPALYGPLALANMTGANRILIGVAWPLIVFIYCWRAKRAGLRADAVPIGDEQGVEVVYLALATIYSFVIPFKGTLSLWDLLVLVTIFGLYVRRVMRSEHAEPDLIGPAKLLGDLPQTARRWTVVALFAAAAVTIFLVAEHFAEALIAAGVNLGFDRRALVQWLAPLASEAPEFIITGVFAWRLLGAASLGALISSKVNQWTLLVSSIPLVFNIATWKLGKAVPTALTLDAEQKHDLLLTSAQSLFAVAVLLRLRLSWRDATALLVLFAAQFFLPLRFHPWLTGLYIALAFGFFVRNLGQIRCLIGLLRDNPARDTDGDGKEDAPNCQVPDERVDPPRKAA